MGDGTKNGAGVFDLFHRSRNVLTAKARIRVHNDYDTFVPVVVPELDSVRRFASELHLLGKPWAGEAFGWAAEYFPERPEPRGSLSRFGPSFDYPVSPG
jgi:hypothetical protein